MAGGRPTARGRPRSSAGRVPSRPPRPSSRTIRARNRQRRWLGVALAALGGVALLAYFPLQAYVEQNRLRSELESQVAEVEELNAQLAARVEELNTDAEIERLARERYHLVMPGEEAYLILPGSGEDPPSTAPESGDGAGEGASEDGASEDGASEDGASDGHGDGFWSRAWKRVTSLL